ncbi:3899_t:CDS:1, partial [Racocetra persica]
FNSCTFVTKYYLKDPNEKIPTEKKLKHIQVEELIKHLQNNYINCWNK